MAGRVTHLQDWAENEGGWEPPVTLKAGARSGLERALKADAIEKARGRRLPPDDIRAIERKLTADEVAAIEKELAPIRHLRTGFKNATTQDIKRTLDNIGKLPPREALAAYHRIDTDTACHIDEAMWSELGLNPHSGEWIHPSGENIARAATAARANMGNGRSGPSSKKAHYREWLTSYALSLWARLGGSDTAAWSYDDDNKPIVDFLVNLASVVDDEPLDASQAAKYLRAVKARPL